MSAVVRSTTLDPDQQQIRLLYVHPATSEAEVACHFSTVSLNNLSIEYEALSYVWGPSTKGHTICIERTHVDVTDNLWQALRSLRYPDRERIMWVDAVCIDQSDHQERSDQVSRMRSIYSRAASVPIYLGEPFDNIERALQFLTEAASGVDIHGNAASFSRLGEFPDPDKDPSDENERSTLDLVNALTAFMNKPWWRRTWTVQEFVLAKKSTFHCGPHQLSGTIIPQAYWRTIMDYQAFVALGFSSSWLAGIGELFMPMLQLLDLLAFDATFLRSVGKIRQRGATDPRDKIYGMMGLGGPKIQNLFRPDYTLPVEKVYEIFVTSLLRETKNLHVLSHVNSHLPTNFKLPSWVPDWTTDLSRMTYVEIEARSVRCDLFDLYNACADTEVDFMVDSASGSLSIRGAIIDTIKGTENYTSTSDDPECYFSKVLDIRQSIANVPPRNEDPKFAKRKAFWLTMCAGVEYRAEQAMLLRPWEKIEKRLSIHDVVVRCDADIDLAAYDVLEEAQRTFKPNDSESVHRLNASHVGNAVINASEGRLFANTEAGRIGQIPTTARPGDVVAVLTGGRVPYVLRPQNGHYLLTGDAYIHGIMDGEAMPAPDTLDYIELR